MFCDVKILFSQTIKQFSGIKFGKLSKCEIIVMFSLFVNNKAGGSFQRSSIKAKIEKNRKVIFHKNALTHFKEFLAPKIHNLRVCLNLTY